MLKNHVKINLKDKVCLIHAPMSNKKMNELLDKSAMKNTKILEVYNLASLILQNESGIKFQIDIMNCRFNGLLIGFVSKSIIYFFF